MKITKLIVGIFSIVLSALLGFQAFIAGIGNIFDDSGDISGTIGIMLAVLLLVSGIVLIATRKSFGGGIAAGIIMLIGGCIRMCSYENYPDLELWTNLSLVFAIIILGGSIIEKIIKKQKAKKQNKENSVSEFQVELPEPEQGKEEYK